MELGLQPTVAHGPTPPSFSWFNRLLMVMVMVNRSVMATRKEEACPKLSGNHCSGGAWEKVQVKSNNSGCTALTAAQQRNKWQLQNIDNKTTETKKQQQKANKMSKISNTITLIRFAIIRKCAIFAYRVLQSPFRSECYNMLVMLSCGTE